MNKIIDLEQYFQDGVLFTDLYLFYHETREMKRVYDGEYMDINCVADVLRAIPPADVVIFRVTYKHSPESGPAFHTDETIFISMCSYEIYDNTNDPIFN